MRDSATFAGTNEETRPRRTNTVIVGAGAAGLAAAACLQKQGVPFVLLEKSNQVGSPWRNHYDRLHVHTDRANSRLPNLPMPEHYPKYPARAQVVEYLELYASHFGLEPEFGQEVVSATRRDGVWQTKSHAALYESPNLVVATGYTRVPYGPNVQIRQDSQIPILDIGTVKLIKNGRIHIHPGIERFTGNGVIFTDGAEAKFDAVILGTGYKPRVNAFLPDVDGILDEEGAPLTNGVEASPGLFFCGFYVSPTGMLREIGIEAKQISQAIARNQIG